MSPVRSVCAAAPLRPVALLALAVLSAASGCFTRTTAEDPLAGPEQDASVWADPDTRERLVRVSALVDGAPRDVYPWLTEAGLMSHWFDGEVRADEGTIESVRPDGSRFRGRVVRREPPTVIGLDVEADGALPARSVLMTLVPEDRWTRVSVDDGPFPDSPEGEAMAESIRRRWSAALADLRRAVERGASLPGE